MCSYTFHAPGSISRKEYIMEDQDEFLMRRSEYEEVGVEINNKAALEDVGQNADLYIANQEDNA